MFALESNDKNVISFPVASAGNSVSIHTYSNSFIYQVDAVNVYDSNICFSHYINVSSSTYLSNQMNITKKDYITSSMMLSFMKEEHLINQKFMRNL